MLKSPSQVCEISMVTLEISQSAPTRPVSPMVAVKFVKAGQALSGIAPVDPVNVVCALTLKAAATNTLKSVKIIFFMCK